MRPAEILFFSVPFFFPLLFQCEKFFQGGWGGGVCRELLIVSLAFFISLIFHSWFCSVSGGGARHVLKILPFSEDRVLDCVDKLRRHPVDPVLRRFCRTQLKRLRRNRIITAIHISDTNDTRMASAVTLHPSTTSRTGRTVLTDAYNVTLYHRLLYSPN